MEGDLVRIMLSAEDRDNDNLAYIFTRPLNQSGEWQTAQGDEGVYNATVFATDGEFVIEDYIVIIVLDNPDLDEDESCICNTCTTHTVEITTSTADSTTTEAEQATTEESTTTEQSTTTEMVVSTTINSAPTFQKISNITVNEGEEIIIPVFASDAENDNIIITYSGWLTSGSYVTNHDDAGKYTVTVTITDGLNEVSQDVGITVLDKNRAPTILGPEEITATEGDTIVIVPDAMDLDGDNIVFTYSGWMDTNSYTTNFNDAGVHTVKLYADDGKHKSYKDIKVYVEDTNRNPTISGLGNITVSEGESFTITGDYDDADEDSLSVTYSGWINTQSYTTTYDDSGVHTVYVNVSDGKTSIVTPVTVIVNNVNRAPAIGSLELIAYEGVEYTLTPNITDADGDALEYELSGYTDTATFTPGYDDAGVHTIDIEVTDDSKVTYGQYEITVLNTNRAPYIDMVSEIYVKEGETIVIAPTLIDLDGDDADFVITGWINQSIYTTTYDDAGNYEIEVTATDGKDFTIQKVEVIVENVNRVPVAYKIIQNFNETDIVEIIMNATDADNDELEYSFSAPLNKDGEWETTYEDAGLYYIGYSVSDGVNVSENIIELRINDVDRAPIFEKVENQEGIETEEVVIVLEAIDEDGDNITFSMEDAPVGANLENNVFTWTPDYDFVQVKTNWFYRFIKWLGLYEDNEKIDVTFIATGKEKSSTQEVRVKILNKNRAPVITSVEGVLDVSETETVEVIVNSYDPDGDKLKTYFSSWMDDDKYTTNYEDAGTHEVWVNVTDGKASAVQKVEITVTEKNRAPIVKSFDSRFEVNEGETLTVELGSHDLDGDVINQSATNYPEGAVISGTKFIYTAPYNAATVKNDETSVNITIFVDDGKEISSSVLPIMIKNVNRAPIIELASPAANFIRIRRGEVINFSIVPYDPDGDQLEITYKFNFVDKIVNGDTHVRRFVNSGKKTVKVIVFDGEDSDEKVWNIEVLPPQKVKTPKDPDYEKYIVFSESPEGRYVIDHT